MAETSTDKLVAALVEADAPADLIERARADYYNDYKSPRAFPAMELVLHLREAGLYSLMVRAINGEFDGTKEEAEQWAASEEGQETVAEIFGTPVAKPAQKDTD